jgi:hypothetical protein
MEKRLDWACIYLHDNFADVIWSDETTVQLETYRHHCYRKLLRLQAWVGSSSLLGKVRLWGWGIPHNPGGYPPSLALVATPFPRQGSNTFPSTNTDGSHKVSNNGASMYISFPSHRLDPFPPYRTQYLLMAASFAVRVVFRKKLLGG